MKQLVAGLKDRGFKVGELASNLDYLIQKGWVREDVLKRTFTTARGTTQEAEKRLYKISDVAIDRLEIASAYQRPPAANGINITNVHGVTVVGDGNVVNTTYTDVARLLDEIRVQILAAAGLDDTKKLDVVADIEGLQAQLQKPSPNRDVVRALWSGVEKTVTAAGFGELMARAASLLAPLIR
jgi:hypothetical protein